MARLRRSRSSTSTYWTSQSGPAVCRRSYIDHRVIDRYLDGETVSAALDTLGRDSPPGSAATDGPVERSVLRLLRGT